MKLSKSAFTGGLLLLLLACASSSALAQASDKEVRTMAQKVVTMQEREVASLQSWLKRNGKKAQ